VPDRSDGPSALDILRNVPPASVSPTRSTCGTHTRQQRVRVASSL
jgi:hypothetical protein